MAESLFQHTIIKYEKYVTQNNCNQLMILLQNLDTFSTPNGCFVYNIHLSMTANCELTQQNVI